MYKTENKPDQLQLSAQKRKPSPVNSTIHKIALIKQQKLKTKQTFNQKIRELLESSTNKFRQMTVLIIDQCQEKFRPFQLGLKKSLYMRKVRWKKRRVYSEAIPSLMTCIHVGNVGMLRASARVCMYVHGSGPELLLSSSVKQIFSHAANEFWFLQ